MPLYASLKQDMTHAVVVKFHPPVVLTAVDAIAPGLEGF